MLFVCFNGLLIKNLITNLCFLPPLPGPPVFYLYVQNGAAGGPRTYRLYTSIFHKKLPIFGNFLYLCKKLG